VPLAGGPKVLHPPASPPPQADVRIATAMAGTIQHRFRVVLSIVDPV